VRIRALQSLKIHQSLRLILSMSLSLSPRERRRLTLDLNSSGKSSVNHETMRRRESPWYPQLSSSPSIDLVDVSTLIS
jgi:hypothetical protein